MKVISILQPWASLTVIGAKHIETRTWNTKYRGPLLIHASKKFTGDQKALGIDFNHRYGVGLGFPEHLPVGQIIGAVNLIDTFPTDRVFAGAGGGIGYKSNLRVVDGDVFRMMQITNKEKAFGDYSLGRYGWLLSDPVQFQPGISINGKLGFWNYDGAISAIQHGPITIKQIVKNVWIATCMVIGPLKCEVEQKGLTEQDAITKLKKFLNT
jgi:activating signal cointegrator 1